LSWIPILGVVVAAAGLFLYWALVITEGAYLGQGVVTLLYDLTPAYYDRIKAITWKRDAECLAEPMMAWLGGVSCPLILDVGTGTGRFPKTMLAHTPFDGQVWGLDVSIGMLRRARDRLSGFGERCVLIRDNADALPFADETFDAVACLETLEFTGSRDAPMGTMRWSTCCARIPCPRSRSIRGTRSTTRCGCARRASPRQRGAAPARLMRGCATRSATRCKMAFSESTRVRHE
jgi:hypothetical protein